MQQPFAYGGGDIAGKESVQRIGFQAVLDKTLRRVRVSNRDPFQGRVVNGFHLPLQFGVTPRQARLADFADDLLDLFRDLHGAGDRFERLPGQEVQYAVRQFTDQEWAGRPQRFGGGVKGLADAVRIKRNLAAVTTTNPCGQMCNFIRQADHPFLVMNVDSRKSGAGILLGSPASVTFWPCFPVGPEVKFR